MDEDTSEVDLNFDPYESDSDYSGSEDENYADSETGVEDAIRSHYAKISLNDYEGAYEKFSSARKSKVTLSGWSNGLKENYRDDVTYLSVNRFDGDTATAYVEMTSYDKIKADIH
ncbi:hypothetical protein [Fictibacillus sp. FJAT-27399]|uniref:hypothetical protein n=1 Tax=Fictibacillus sp. FJAT-27399 TaxID=1729689 RepID=UPI0007814378|nr:hypothetical protein [Fictibacillus sp. FJAT-27399]